MSNFPSCILQYNVSREKEYIGDRIISPFKKESSMSEYNVTGLDPNTSRDLVPDSVEGTSVQKRRVTDFYLFM